MIKKNIYILLGSISVLLGSIGIFVPLLPTTPFLLLAIYFYMNSSDKALKWLLSNKYLSPYIRSYTENKGIPGKVLFKTIILLWGTILISFFFFTDNIYIRIFLIIVAICVTLHVWNKREHKNK